MKLDRDTNPDGKGKYVLINLRHLPHSPFNVKELSEMIQVHQVAVEFGEPKTQNEFFPIKLKDKYAQAALKAYADAARPDDPEYADAVEALAKRAGPGSPFCKKPD